MIDRRYGKRLMQAFDYSDGVELVETMFAIRFEGVEMANEFKKEFERLTRPKHSWVRCATTTAFDATTHS